MRNPFPLSVDDLFDKWFEGKSAAIILDEIGFPSTLYYKTILMRLIRRDPRYDNLKDNRILRISKRNRSNVVIDIDEVYKRTLKGESISGIARHFNVSRSFVENIVKKDSRFIEKRRKKREKLYEKQLLGQNNQCNDDARQNYNCFSLEQIASVMLRLYEDGYNILDIGIMFGIKTSSAYGTVRNLIFQFKWIDVGTKNFINNTDDKS